MAADEQEGAIRQITNHSHKGMVSGFSRVNIWGRGWERAHHIPRPKLGMTRVLLPNLRAN